MPPLRLLTTKNTIPLLIAVLGISFWSCDNAKDSPSDTSTTSFRVNFTASSSLSSSPFPSNHYLSPQQTIKMPPLKDDPILGTMANSEILQILSARINERGGFSFAAPAFFFVDEEIDIASASNQIQFITLSGPEAGRVIQPQAFWSPHAKALGVMHTWGDYLMPATTYGIIIRGGIAFVSGKKVNPGEIWPQLFASTQPDNADASVVRGREVLKPLRDYLASSTASAHPIVAATVFTTQQSLPYAEAAFNAIDNFFESEELPKPSRDIRYDSSSQQMETASIISGEPALATYFGTASSPFELNPGSWSEWNRNRAASLEGGERYDGGSFYKGVGMVLNGTVVAPALNYQYTNNAAQNAPFTVENGAVQWQLNTMIPYTLYLCEQHLQENGSPIDEKLPLGLFAHGGSGSRNAALSYAVMNCLQGVATLTYDLPYHGGRSTSQLIQYNDSLTLAPTASDKLNAYTGLESQSGPSDYVGDLVDATVNVGQLYALSSNLDPAVIETNFMTVAAETYALTRYAIDGDWSGILAGLRFDPDRLFHQSQSYGTSFNQAVFALRPNYAGIIMGVGSSYMIMANIPMAPSNAHLGSTMMSFAMGLKTKSLELQSGSFKDPIIAIHQWLAERSDASAFAPYVLRHRQDDKSMNLLQIGNSWDHTLSHFAQLSLDAALGTPAFRYGANWTLDKNMAYGENWGENYAGTISNNITFNEQSHTAALYYHSRSCHSLMSSPLCSISYELAYPPLVELEAPIAYSSPICEYQGMASEFIKQVLLGSPQIGAPTKTCEELYLDAK